MKTNLNIEDIKNTILNFVVPIICFVICGVLGYFIIFKSISGAPGKKQEITANDESRARLEDKLKKLTTLSSYRSSIRENAEIVNKALVSAADTPMLLDQINQIGSSAGLKIEKLASSGGSNNSSGTEPTANTIKNATASLSAEGTYDQFITTLKSIENASRILSLKDFRFSARTSTKGDVSSSADMSIDGPYMSVNSQAIVEKPIDLDISDSKFRELITQLKGLQHYEFTNSKLPEPEVQPETPVESEQPAPTEEGTGGGGQ